MMRTISIEIWDMRISVARFRAKPGDKEYELFIIQSLANKAKYKGAVLIGSHKIS
ncbi:hypothetical protein [Flagellimonas halotolerans]|uniref:Uncharacterized protein n=1 Tax=Flagellimonas halotolerans TaxID=3112164 RepID=A0ABU6ISK0_9FLAO|nr:hypothetical protein [Muricauda sp. SYSU M86414]MEC3966201.1 hypothetical protein [Muricauda sp. SYSU M86414]MEC4266113.1 hypothetical protein [Muricauda sp. SYSU M84420]